MVVMYMLFLWARRGYEVHGCGTVRLPVTITAEANDRRKGTRRRFARRGLRASRVGACSHAVCRGRRVDLMNRNGRALSPAASRLRPRVRRIIEHGALDLELG